MRITIIKIFITYCLGFFFIISCDNSTSNSNNIVGTWDDECVYDLNINLWTKATYVITETSDSNIYDRHYYQEGYPEANCNGIPGLIYDSIAQYIIGNSIQTTIGIDGPLVNATEYDVSTPTGYIRLYSIFYVDIQSTPNRLHFGMANGANDGSSESNRRNILYPEYLVRR